MQRPYGLTFINCRLERENGVPTNSVALGRPWHPTTTFSDGRYADPYAVGKATFINTFMESHITTKRWASMTGRAKHGNTITFNPHTDGRFAEHKSHGPGAHIVMSNAVHDSHILTAQQADFYSRTAILRGWRAPIVNINTTH